MSITITLTQGGAPLANITTWDKFYQAALRAQAIQNPMDELDALLNAQELCAEDGFKLIEVPATGRGHLTWGAGKSARRPQSYWFSLVERMGMTIKETWNS